MSSFEEKARNSGLGECFHEGKRAVKDTDKEKIEGTRGRFTGSVDLDECLEGEYPNSPRWDYAIGFKPEGGEERVFFVEVHPVSSGRHVEEVIKKAMWLKGWKEGTAFREDNTLIWVASGGVSLTPTGPKRKELSTEGIMGPYKWIDLKDFC